MKILSVISPVKFGGGERLLLDQMKVFKEKGIDYVIVCFTKNYARIWPDLEFFKRIRNK